MMSAMLRHYWTPEEYLAFERASDTKHEYYQGEIYDMAGATKPHIIITGNIQGELRSQLRRRPCNIYATEMRVDIPGAGLYTYPDIVIVCGDEKFKDERQDTLLNPTVIIEVLSPSTEDYDR